MCFEKKKKTLEKEAVKMKMLTARHIQTEREILASDMEEMKKIQSEIKSVLKENEGLNSALKAAAAEYQKQHQLIERELMEAENEYKRNLQAIFNEASEIERSEEEDFKVGQLHFFSFMYSTDDRNRRSLLRNVSLWHKIKRSVNWKSRTKSPKRSAL